jgi:hypothetical protein
MRILLPFIMLLSCTGILFAQNNVEVFHLTVNGKIIPLSEYRVFYSCLDSFNVYFYSSRINGDSIITHQYLQGGEYQMFVLYKGVYFPTGYEFDQKPSERNQLSEVKIYINLSIGKIWYKSFFLSRFLSKKMEVKTEIDGIGCESCVRYGIITTYPNFRKNNRMMKRNLLMKW